MKAYIKEYIFTFTLGIIAIFLPNIKYHILPYFIKTDNSIILGNFSILVIWIFLFYIINRYIKPKYIRSPLFILILICLIGYSLIITI